MDPLQRTAGPAPTASSQDPPRIRRSERNSPVKNRMRETCTSGSVRGGDGDIPTYSALDAPQRGDEALERGLVGEPACALKNFNWPASCASASMARILPLKRRASRLTCTRKSERQATHRDPSSESPPPGTIICTCG